MIINYLSKDLINGFKLLYGQINSGCYPIFSSIDVEIEYLTILYVLLKLFCVGIFAIN